MSLAVVGTAHPNRRGPTRAFELAMCEPGEPVELRPEPKNPADPNAIAVFSCRGIQLGYLTAERAPWIGALMARGEEMVVVFQRRTPWGAWLRAGFDGEAPPLPEEPVTRADENCEADPEPGFYPDEVWPD